MQSIKKVTGYRGINKNDNLQLNNFIRGLLREYAKLPKQFMLEFPVIMQMAEHRVENLRIIQNWKEFPEDKILKLAHSAFREGFLAGAERVRLVRMEDIKQLQEHIHPFLDGPEKSG